MKPETKKTFKVAVTLCLVCSVVVSTLAVGLKDKQQEQKDAFRQQSILEAAGLWEKGARPGELYKEKITPVVVDLQTNEETDRFKPDAEDLKLDAMLRNPDMIEKISVADNVAGLKDRDREIYSVVYQVKSDSTLKTIVLPIRGRGLWSTLYGFVAIDLTEAEDGPEELKVAGLTYYKHGETPGLGGEVDNPLWKQKWPGKLIFNDDWDVKIEVAKNADTDYQVDALSGATLTSNGVTNMLQFWLGKEGFGPYLQNVIASHDSSSSDKSSPDTDSGTDTPDSSAAE